VRHIDIPLTSKNTEEKSTMKNPTNLPQSKQNSERGERAPEGH
jgi:hypothetical protein